MSAYQAGTVSATFLAGTIDANREIVVQNLGPNPLYLSVGGAAAGTASSLKVATNDVFIFRQPALTAVYAVTSSAAQVSPADTRYEVL